MHTPKNAPYKQIQRASENSKKNYTVVWTSCYTVKGSIPGTIRKIPVDGQCIKQQVGVKGKAAKKALRKATHTKGYYKSLRTEV